jgi:diguanylate cyclase (GGDEF)-like protein
MSRFTFNRKRLKLKKLLGIRARLALLALILVAPLMLDRARSLEDTRAKEIAQATREFHTIAQRSVQAQREIIASVETTMKSAAYISASAGGVDRSCDLLRTSLKIELPWIRGMSIVAADGRVQCSTLPRLVGMNIGDRGYFKRAVETRGFVFSDYLFARVSKIPTMMGAFPVSAIAAGEEAVIVAGINLDWMSKIVGDLDGHPGISAVLIDSEGLVLAAPPDQADMIGHPLDNLPMLAAVSDKAIGSDQATESVAAAADGSRRTVSFTLIPGTGSRLVVSVDEAKVAASTNGEIRTAYLELGLVSLFVLLGALIAAEKLIVQPIEMMAAMTIRFGRGDWSARAARSRLPAEFIPLARAFNAMAAQLGQRERELIATNDRLTVMASIDMLSGLANRRGFLSRLEFEWMKAQQQNDHDLSLLMIDVDHFKLFNDTYGHPEGDTCLSRLGETLAGIAAENFGFAGRYGGEEFCLLLPNTDISRAVQIGETVRLAVLALAMPHCTSSHQTVTVSVGVACSQPNGAHGPGDLIEAADAALYAAKHRGRNAVVEHGLVRPTDGDGPIALAS